VRLNQLKCRGLGVQAGIFTSQSLVLVVKAVCQGRLMVVALVQPEEEVRWCYRAPMITWVSMSRRTPGLVWHREVHQHYQVPRKQLN